MRRFFQGRGQSLYIGRFLRIAFYLDYSWFAMAAIVTFTLATDFFPELEKGHSQPVYLAMGISGALLFFFSILLHELGHSVVSQRCGIPVPRITLQFIGGVAEIAREPDDAMSELKIALGGPAVSVLLIVFYAGVSGFLEGLGWLPAAVVFYWLAWANGFLVIFNMIPGYPLDGGRVLRALLWARSGRLRQSTFITSRIGIGFSWVLIAWGSYCVLALHQLSALSFLLIGMFLKGAAQRGYANAVQRELLANLCVRDIMTAHPLCIPASLPLNLAVDDFFRLHHHLVFPVCDSDNDFRGLLHLNAIRSIERAKWPYTSVSEIVSETDWSHQQIGANETAAHAMRILMSPNRDRLAVLEAGKVAGIITRSDMLRVIRIHTQLEA